MSANKRNNNINDKIFNQNSWREGRLKDIFSVSQGLQISQSLRFYSPKENSVKYITLPSIDGKIEEYIYKPSINVLCKPSDILVVRTGAVGKIVRNVQGAFHNNFFKAKVKKGFDSFYCFHLLNSPAIQNTMIVSAGLTAIPDLNHNEFYTIKCELPPLTEQTQIANYLDTKTQAIDKKIKLLTTKIEYYKELRKTIINNAVTKGLDKNVKLKESELGLKPSHWAISRLKEVSKTMSSGATPLTNIDAYYEDGIVNWVNTGDLNDGIVENCQYKISQLAINDYPNLKVNKPGTLMIAMYGATIGKIGLLNIYATSNQACCCINFNKHNFSKFYFYWFLAYKQFMISLSVGGTQPNVGQGIIGKMLVAVPPIKEQTEIATYLDAKTNTIDKITTNLQTQIETLKELRKTLINDVVTGKVKVIANEK